jgi:formylglycine-generating enzyme required for sulfatase activity
MRPDAATQQRSATLSFATQELAAGDAVTNSLGMKLVLIPAGQFEMGRNMPEGEPDTGPVAITIPRSFLMGATEVTQNQWQRLMGSAPWERTASVKQGPHCPAADINWHNAVTFCVKLTAAERASNMLSTDEAYRLPTEAEWEYACRAGSTTYYCFGDDHSKLDEYAWWGAFNGYDNDRKQLPGIGPCKDEPFAHPVGLKRPNPWGLYDMYGNVWEWCGDWYADTYSGGVDAGGPSSGDRRVQRGGSWSNPSKSCRTHGRRPTPPDLGSSTYGLRVVLSKEKPSSP